MTLPALLSRKDDRNTGNPWIETAEFIHGKKVSTVDFSKKTHPFEILKHIIMISQYITVTNPRTDPIIPPSIAGQIPKNSSTCPDYSPINPMYFATKIYELKKIPRKPTHGTSRNLPGTRAC
jgi:hypothetical protein